MQKHRRDTNFGRSALIAAAALLATAVAGHAMPAAAYEPSREAVELAQTETPPRELEPRYQPAPPEEKSSYNSSYIFGATRGVADSTMVPAVKGLLFVLTVPLDLVLLPFTTIGGFFG